MPNLSIRNLAGYILIAVVLGNFVINVLIQLATMIMNITLLLKLSKSSRVFRWIQQKLRWTVKTKPAQPPHRDNWNLGKQTDSIIRNIVPVQQQESDICLDNEELKIRTNPQIQVQDTVIQDRQIYRSKKREREERILSTSTTNANFMNQPGQF